jgi:hypothetical protein
VHGSPIATLLLSINPLVQFIEAQGVISLHHYYRCPAVTVFHWNVPEYLPTFVHDHFERLDVIADLGYKDFLGLIEEFLISFYSPVSPYEDTPYNPLNPPRPPLVPFTPTFPDIAPLVHEQ